MYPARSFLDSEQELYIANEGHVIASSEIEQCNQHRQILFDPSHSQTRLLHEMRDRIREEYVKTFNANNEGLSTNPKRVRWYAFPFMFAEETQNKFAGSGIPKREKMSHKYAPISAHIGP